MIAVPVPPWTRGTWPLWTYRRRPGRETRSIPVMTGWWSLVYLSVTLIFSPTSAGPSVEAGDVALLVQDPGDLQLQLRGRDLDVVVAGAERVADAGQVVSDRVGKHDLPARLGHAGDVALVSGLPEADPADAELPVIGTRTAAPAAAVVFAGLELRFALLAHLLGSLGHRSSKLSSAALSPPSSALSPSLALVLGSGLAYASGFSSFSSSSAACSVSAFRRASSLLLLFVVGFGSPSACRDGPPWRRACPGRAAARKPRRRTPQWW